MAKIITVTDISLKEINISKISGKITVGLLYSLLDNNGKEYDQKRDLIKDEELSPDQRAKINNILATIDNKIKQREGI